MRRIPGIRRVFRHARENDVGAEMQFHIDARTDELVRLGVARDEARQRALAEFGDLPRYEDETRDIDRGHARSVRVREFLSSVWFDLSHAVRGLRRSPGFAAAALLTIALGIGANTAVWTIVDALMRRPLPIDRPEELHAARRTDGANDGEYRRSYPRFRRLQAVLPGPRQLAAMSAIARLYATTGDQPEPVVAQLVSGDWFGMLGVGAAAGRPIGPDDERTGEGSPVVVLSDGFWTRRFARDPRVVGTTIRLGGTPVRVVGVAEPGFQGLWVGQPIDVWLPLTAQSAVGFFANMSAADADPEKPWPPQEGIRWLTLVARVAPAQAA